MNGWVPAAAINGFLAVAAGAFAAHGMEGDAAEWLRTGSRYEMWHALALLAVAWRWQAAARRRAVAVAGWAFVLGTVLFSGSLYLLAFTGWRGAAMAAPFGGAAFLVGWAALGLSALPASARDATGGGS